MIEVEIPQGALEQIVGPVIEAMFGLPLLAMPDPGEVPGAYSASIRIRGHRESLLCVEAAPALAADLARLLLALEQPPSPADTRDALAEITNTIAGNFKSAFTPGARLALPCIGNPAQGQPATETVAYRYGGGVLRVSRYAA